MKYRYLGSTGVRVSQLCLGAMMFGAWGNPDHDESVKIIHSALDAGINFIDTADVYSAGESEAIVAKAIAGRRDHLVVATKVHGQMGEDRNMMGNSRRWIIQECENSLRRLGTDYIEVHYTESLPVVLIQPKKVEKWNRSNQQHRSFERYSCPAYRPGTRN